MEFPLWSNSALASFPGPVRSSLAVYEILREFRTASDERARGYSAHSLHTTKKLYCASKMAAGLVILVFLLVAEFCAGELNLKCYIHIAMICIAPCMSWNGAFGFSRVCKTAFAS